MMIVYCVNCAHRGKKLCGEHRQLIRASAVPAVDYSCKVTVEVQIDLFTTSNVPSYVRCSVRNKDGNCAHYVPRS